MSQSVNDIQGLRRRIKFAYLDATTLGNTAFVTAVTGYHIVVLGVVVVALTAVVVHFEGATTQISADNACGATGGWTMPYAEQGWFETATGVALNLNLSGNVNVGATIIYELRVD